VHLRMLHTARFARPKHPRKLTSEVIAGMTET